MLAGLLLGGYKAGERGGRLSQVARHMEGEQEAPYQRDLREDETFPGEARVTSFAPPGDGGHGGEEESCPEGGAGGDDVGGM